MAEQQTHDPLGSTIKFPAVPETQNFDSDGLFEDSLNEPESPTMKHTPIGTNLNRVTESESSNELNTNG